MLCGGGARGEDFVCAGVSLRVEVVERLDVELLFCCVKVGGEVVFEEEGDVVGEGLREDFNFLKMPIFCCPGCASLPFLLPLATFLPVCVWCISARRPAFSALSLAGFTLYIIWVRGWI